MGCRSGRSRVIVHSEQSGDQDKDHKKEYENLLPDLRTLLQLFRNTIRDASHPIAEKSPAFHLRYDPRGLLEMGLRPEGLGQAGVEMAQRQLAAIGDECRRRLGWIIGTVSTRRDMYGAHMQE